MVPVDEDLLVLKHNALHTYTHIHTTPQCRNHDGLFEAINLPGDTLLADETGVFTCT